MNEVLCPVVPERGAPTKEAQEQLGYAACLIAAIEKEQGKLPVNPQSGIVERSVRERRLQNELNDMTGVRRALRERGDIIETETKEL